MPFPPRSLDHYRKADRIMLGLIWLMFVFAMGLAFWYDTFKQALLVGGGISVLLTLLYRAIGGSRWMHWGGRFISNAAVGAAFIPNGKTAGNPQARQVADAT